MRRRIALGAAALAAVLTGQARAGALNLIANPNFSTLGNTNNGYGGYGSLVTQSSGGNLQTGTGVAVATGWSAGYVSGQSQNCLTGYSCPFLFLASPAGVDTTNQGFYDIWDKGLRYIWGPNDGSNNGYNGVAPGGGNVLVMDAAYNPAPIEQTISTGLIKGDHYQLTFNWAGAQWADGNGNANGATTEGLTIMLGDLVYNTGLISNSAHGFTGWMNTTWNFTYDGSGTLLSFLASSTSTGDPPVVLLDDVTLYDTPEPAAYSIWIVGIAAAAYLRFRRTPA